MSLRFLFQIARNVKIPNATIRSTSPCAARQPSIEQELLSEDNQKCPSTATCDTCKTKTSTYYYKTKYFPNSCKPKSNSDLSKFIKFYSIWSRDSGIKFMSTKKASGSNNTLWKCVCNIFTSQKKGKPRKDAKKISKSKQCKPKLKCKKCRKCAKCGKLKRKFKTAKKTTKNTTSEKKPDTKSCKPHLKKKSKCKCVSKKMKIKSKGKTGNCKKVKWPSKSKISSKPSSTSASNPWKPSRERSSSKTNPRKAQATPKPQCPPKAPATPNTQCPSKAPATLDPCLTLLKNKHACEPKSYENDGYLKCVEKSKSVSSNSRSACESRSYKEEYPNLRKKSNNCEKSSKCSNGKSDSSISNASGSPKKCSSNQASQWPDCKSKQINEPCAPRQQTTCTQEYVHPPCKVQKPPFASFSECHPPFAKIRSTETEVAKQRAKLCKSAARRLSKEKPKHKYCYNCKSPKCKRSYSTLRPGLRCSGFTNRRKLRSSYPDKKIDLLEEGVEEKKQELGNNTYYKILKPLEGDSEQEMGQCFADAPPLNLFSPMSNSVSDSISFVSNFDPNMEKLDENVLRLAAEFEKIEVAETFGGYCNKIVHGVIVNGNEVQDLTNIEELRELLSIIEMDNTNIE